MKMICWFLILLPGIVAAQQTGSAPPLTEDRVSLLIEDNGKDIENRLSTAHGTQTVDGSSSSASVGVLAADPTC